MLYYEGPHIEIYQKKKLYTIFDNVIHYDHKKYNSGNICVHFNYILD